MESIRPGHYIYREPIVTLGLFSLIVALAIMLFAISEIQSLKSRMSVTFSSKSNSELPTIVITENSWVVNGQSVPDSDLMFKLTAISNKGTAAVVQANPGLSGDKLSHGLKVLSNCGFTNIALINTQNLATGK